MQTVQWRVPDWGHMGLWMGRGARTADPQELSCTDCPYTVSIYFCAFFLCVCTREWLECRCGVLRSPFVLSCPNWSAHARVLFTYSEWTNLTRYIVVFRPFVEFCSKLYYACAGCAILSISFPALSSNSLYWAYLWSYDCPSVSSEFSSDPRSGLWDTLHSIVAELWVPCQPRIGYLFMKTSMMMYCCHLAWDKCGYQHCDREHKNIRT